MPLVLATSDGTKNLYGLDRIAVEQGGTWRYSLADALGSVRQWTDPAGAVLGVQSYGPFGEPRGPVGTPPWGYTGEWQDPAGMVYLRARWYDPALGRFHQVDPVAGGLMVPATLHPYAYVLNDPLNDTDPSGEVGLLAALGISVGVGALAGAIGGGVSYAIANPGHSLGEYVRDPGFQRSVASGAVGGAVAGLAIWALPTPTTFLGAVGVGVVSGSLGGGASRVTENLLTPCAGWYESVPEAMLVGGISGGATAGLFYGIRQLLAPAINTGNTTVYRYLENGKTRYVGITDDFARRAGEHLRRGWQIQRIPGLEHLSRSDARAVEQVLIERYGLPNLYNKINSIAPSSSIYKDAVRRGSEILARVLMH